MYVLGMILFLVTGSALCLSGWKDISHSCSELKFWVHCSIFCMTFCHWLSTVLDKHAAAPVHFILNACRKKWQNCSVWNFYCWQSIWTTEISMWDSVLYFAHVFIYIYTLNYNSNNKRYYFFPVVLFQYLFCFVSVIVSIRCKKKNHTYHQMNDTFQNKRSFLPTCTHHAQTHIHKPVITFIAALDTSD